MNFWKKTSQHTFSEFSAFHGRTLRPGAAFVLGAALMSGGVYAVAQDSQTQSQTGDSAYAAADAQTESNVIVALDSSSPLRNQQIAASTVNGDVTLTGMVSDQASKDMAEQVAARVKGVRSVSNNLTVASPAQAASLSPASGQQQEVASNQQVQYGPAPNEAQDQNQPVLAQPVQDQEQPLANQPVPQQDQVAQAQPPMPDNGQNGQMQPPPTSQPNAQSAPYPYPSGPAPRPDDDQDQAAPPPAYPQNGAQQGNPQANPQGNGYPQQQGPAPRQPYGQPQYGDNQGGYNQGPYNNQQGGYGQGGYNQGPYNQRGYDDNDGQGYGRRHSGPVTLPASTILRVRTNDFMDARKLKPGATFQVTAAQDIYVGGVIAVPRGATLDGVVTDVKDSSSGSMTGSNAITLQLTNLDLEGRAYPITTDMWTGKGPGKGAYSANNTIGGAAVGAVIGAIIGRGPGAAIGAVAGGATGAAASSASSGPRVVLAPETILTFHLTQPVTVKPVSNREAQRLAQSQPTLQQRPYYPPPPPPGYYYPRAYYPY